MRWEEKLFLILISKYIRCKHFTFMRKFNIQLYEYESLLSAQMKIVIFQTHHFCHIYQIKSFSVIFPSRSVSDSRKLAQGYKFSLLSDFVLSRYIFSSFNFISYFVGALYFRNSLLGFFVGIFCCCSSSNYHATATKSHLLSFRKASRSVPTQKIVICCKSFFSVQVWSVPVSFQGINHHCLMTEMTLSLYSNFK